MKIVKRYNVSLNVWEIGYWSGTRFVIVDTVKVLESV